jgi:hypothetical protein
MDKHLFTQVLILFLLLSGKPTKADSKHHASVLPGGLQAQKSATRRATKLLVSKCKTSAEKLLDFTAEVGEVLLSVFSIPPARILHRTLRI